MNALTEINGLVGINGGKLVTTSVKIGLKFEKQHKNILRDIQNLGCSEKFGRLNFEPITYLDDRNREQPMYLVTRDGFMILAMGFTGPEAMKFKEAYIAEFNRMEAYLKTEHSQAITHRQVETLSHSFMNLKTEIEKLTRPSSPHSDINRFLQYCNIGNGLRTEKQILFSAYIISCGTCGTIPCKYNMFFSRLYAAAPLVNACRHNGAPGVRGIALKVQGEAA